MKPPTDGDVTAFTEVFTGLDELLKLPSPGWPSSLRPQHWTVPAPIDRAQAWLFPMPMS